MAGPHLVSIGDALADFVVAVGPGTGERLGVAPGAAAFPGRAALDEALAALGGGPAGGNARGRAPHALRALSAHRLVAEHRGRFDALVAAGVEAVIGNEAEVTVLVGTDDVDLAAATVSRMGPLAVVTLGERGALAHGPEGRRMVAARSARVA